MLSYLKEGQTHVPAAEASTQKDTDTPLSRQDDYLTVSGHTQKLRQSTILLIVLFGVSALGVWFMVKKTTPATVEAAEDSQAQIEIAIAQLSGAQSEINTQMDSVIGRFHQFSNVSQVHVDELQKNPFKREAAADQEIDKAALLREQQQARQRQALGMAHGLELWSITSTPQGICCMIDDKVLYVGDTINGLTVSEIGTKSAILSYDGVNIELKLDE